MKKHGGVRPVSMDTALRLFESGDGVAGVTRLVTQLGAARRTMSSSAWHLFTKWVVTHPVATYIHGDPLTHRAFHKPRGYAADAVMMDYIYGLQSPHVEASSKPVTDYTTATGTVARAMRHRRQVFAESLDTQVAAGGRAVRVTALACGHARELALSASAQQGLASVTAIDHDAASLEVVTRDYRDTAIHPVVGSVCSVLSGKLKLPAADLVYSAGLYDSLTQPVAYRLTHWLFDSVSPGGSLLLANFLPSIPDIGYMESFMDWQLVYRDDRQMRALADSLPASRVASIRQFHDPLGAITFLKVTRR